MQAVLVDNDGYNTAAYIQGGHLIIIHYEYDGSLLEVETKKLI